MGGLLILLSLLVSVLLWSDLSNRAVWAVIGVTVGYGILGFVDDMINGGYGWRIQFNTGIHLKDPG